MKIKKESILYRTNQAWKYRVMVLLNSIGSIFITLIILRQVNVMHFTYFDDLELAVIGLVFLLLGSVFALSISCPRCRCRWWWYMLKSKYALVKRRDLRTQKECPSCGFVDEEVT